MTTNKDIVERLMKNKGRGSALEREAASVISDLRKRVAELEEHGHRLIITQNAYVAELNATIADLRAKAEEPKALSDKLNKEIMAMGRVIVDLVKERDDARAKLAEADETQALKDRLAYILTRTAIALHGGPLHNGLWSWHDLPELATALRAALAEIKQISSFRSDEFGVTIFKIAKAGLDGTAPLPRKGDTQ